VLKVSYLKFSLGAIFIFCLFTNIKSCQADVIWSSNFNEETIDGWTTKFGTWEIINNTIRAGEQDPEKESCLLIHPSTVAYGTWSFDFKLNQDEIVNFVFITNNATYYEYGYNYYFEIIPAASSTLFAFQKVQGSFNETDEILDSKRIYYLPNVWHHIDITRNPNGEFSFYLDSELLFETIDHNITTSEEFRIVSQSYGAYIDNIEVSDEIRIWSDDFYDGNYDGWKVTHGEWEISNETLQPLDVTDLNYCVITHPSTVAYGTWSFDLKLTPYKNFYFAFINSNGTFATYGYFYELQIFPQSTSSQFRFRKVTGDYETTLENLFDHFAYTKSDDWNHIDITRDQNGKFSMFLDKELLFEVTDDNITTSEAFIITSHPHGGYIDNIEVSDEVLVHPQTVVEETSSLYEYGPYQAGWKRVFNISVTSGKQLPLKIYYPALESAEDAEPISIDAPYPALLFSPGLNVAMVGYENLAEMLTSWGFSVTLVGSGWNADDTERAEDLLEALEWIIEQNVNSSSILYQLFDESRFGVAGHSMGANAAILAAINETMFKALVPISAWVPTEQERATYYSMVELTYDVLSEIKDPVLYILGSNDDGGNLDSAPVMYDETDSPKFLIYTTGDDHTSVRLDSISFKYIAMFCKVYLSGEEDYSCYLYGEYAEQDVDEGFIELYYDISETQAELPHVSEEEESTEVSEPEPETEEESSGGIPSFPIISILAAVVIYYTARKWM
jgi:hypothetical protein